ncbi:TM244 protein, partial [Rhodinocichla rosea]|nr:TM244 protein [Rhodinocichla rosea]
YSLFQVVLVNLLICIIVFYTVYYVVLSVCFAVFRIKMLDGLAPFDFKTNPSWINPYYLALLISVLLFKIQVIFWLFVDYICTFLLLAVMSEFPLMLHWWLALGSGVISMICGGQILAYYLFKDNFIYPILDDF